MYYKFLALILSLGVFCFSSETLYRVSISPENFDLALQTLQKEMFDIAGADHQSGKIQIIAKQEELSRLRELNLNFEILENSESILRDSDLLNYTDPEEMEQFLFNIASQYPDLMELVLLRNDLFEGHNQWAVKITSSRKIGPKPVFLMDGQHHAREVMTAEITKDAIEYLLSNYGKDERVTKWVDEIEIWIVPIVNPDGAAFVFKQNPWWRKNRHPQCAVDLNRNYPITWNKCRGSSGVCTDETYRGESAGSEPETQGIVALMYTLRPKFYLTYHSYGQYIIYPYGCDYTPEDDTFYEIAQGLNAILEDDNGIKGKYRVGTSFNTLYATDGTSDDEPYAKYGGFPFTIEVNSDRSGGFQPNYTKWRDITVQRQRVAWAYFLDQTLEAPQIKGTVYNAFTKKPLENVQFTVEGIKWDVFEEARKSDENGRFFFITQKNKEYTLNFTKEGYFEYQVKVQVGEGPVEIQVPLIPQPKILEGFDKVH
ncbi:MAG: M14 family zinc carboxypeptidase [Thermoanaerobaculia bacterium]